MELLEQNAYLLAFFNYVVAKLTKNRQKPPVLHKVNGAMFFKKWVFSVPRMFLTNSFKSLRKLHYWIANGLIRWNKIEIAFWKEEMKC